MSENQELLETLGDDPEAYRKKVLESLHQEGTLDEETLKLLQTLDPQDIQMYRSMMPATENAAFQALMIEMFHYVVPPELQEEAIHRAEGRLEKMCDLGLTVAKNPTLAPIMKLLGGNLTRISQVCSKIAMKNLRQKVLDQ